eukprot:Seg2013.9 transcript_id=Seg2013.9/GoldUCD/mRNA.D3Y31 product="hypothetical protein" protein_id=Seg2013.9/GoldUCD/D3Y31
MAEQVFGLTIGQLKNAEVTLHADTEVASLSKRVDKPKQIGNTQRESDNTLKLNTPSSKDNKDEPNFKQKAFSMFLELKESMKDIQSSIDMIMPSIKRIDKWKKVWQTAKLNA